MKKGAARKTCWMCKGWGVVAPYALPHKWSDGSQQVLWGPSCAVIRPGVRECPACASGEPDISDPGGKPDEAASCVEHGI